MIWHKKIVDNTTTSHGQSQSSFNIINGSEVNEILGVGRCGFWCEFGVVVVDWGLRNEGSMWMGCAWGWSGDVLKKGG